MAKVTETIHIEHEDGTEITLVKSPERPIFLHGYGPSGDAATIPVHPEMLKQIIYYLQRFDNFS